MRAAKFASHELTVDALAADIGSDFCYIDLRLAAPQISVQVSWV